MKKSQLKEIIHNIVSRKLQESVGQKKTTYGYVMSDKDTDDPTLQLIGYGNMPKSLWKKKIERYAEELLKRVKNDDWRNAAYLMEKNGVFNSSVNMMKEVFSENLNEVDVESNTADQTSDQTPDPAEAKKQKELVDLKKKQTDLNDKVRKMDAAKQKLEDPIRRKIQNLEIKKAPVVKQLGAVTKQIQDIENK